MLFILINSEKYTPIHFRCHPDHRRVWCRAVSGDISPMAELHVWAACTPWWEIWPRAGRQHSVWRRNILTYKEELPQVECAAGRLGHAAPHSHWAEIQLQRLESEPGQPGHHGRVEWCSKADFRDSLQWRRQHENHIQHEISDKVRLRRKPITN